MSDFERWLDRMLPAEMILGRTAVPIFLVCGLFGVAAGSMSVITLVAVRDADLWMAMGMVGVACATFVAMSLLHQRVRGWEEHVHLRDTYAVLAVVALLLWATNNPVLLYLDALAVGLSVFMIFGRFGCTAAGCCYGVCSSVGIRYPRHSSSDAERVRRFPVQPIEAAVWIGVAAAGALVAVVGSLGQATGLTLVLCGITRICTDSLRVDPRPHWWGISEARLLSLLGICVGTVLYQHPGEWTVNGLMFGGIGLLMGTLLYLGRRRWLTLPAPLPALLPQRAAEIGRTIVSQLSTVSRRATSESEVRTYAIDDLRIGVSRDPAGPDIHLVLSVSRSNSSGPLLAVEAEYVLGLVAGHIGMAPEAIPPVVESKRGLFLVQLTRMRPPGATREDNRGHDISPGLSAAVPSTAQDSHTAHQEHMEPMRPTPPVEPTSDYFSPLLSPTESDGE